MSKLIVALFLCLLPGFAFSHGGDQVGNGGDVLVCVKGAKRVVEALDISEGKDLYGFSYGRFASAVDIQRKLEENLGRLDSSRLCLYRLLSQIYPLEMKFIYQSLPDVKDEGSVVIPQGCSLKQAVIRYDSFANGQRRYYVDVNLLEQLDSLNKVALKLHEIVYREARVVRASTTDSQAVRRFVAYLLSDEIRNSSQEEYQRELRKAGLPSDGDYCNAQHPIYGIYRK